MAHIILKEQENDRLLQDLRNQIQQLRKTNLRHRQLLRQEETERVHHLLKEEENDRQLQDLRNQIQQLRKTNRQLLRQQETKRAHHLLKEQENDRQLQDLRNQIQQLRNTLRNQRQLHALLQVEEEEERQLLLNQMQTQRAQLTFWRQECRKKSQTGVLSCRHELETLGWGVIQPVIAEACANSPLLHQMLGDLPDVASLDNAQIQRVHSVYVLWKMQQQDYRPISGGMERTATYCVWYVGKAISEQTGPVCYAHAAADMILFVYSRIVGLRLPKYSTLVEYFASRISRTEGGNPHRCATIFPYLRSQVIYCSPIGPANFAQVIDAIRTRPLLFSFVFTNKSWEQFRRLSVGYRYQPISIEEFETDYNSINVEDGEGAHAVVLLDILQKDNRYYFELKNSWGKGIDLCDDGIYYVQKEVFDRYSQFSIYDVYFYDIDLPNTLKNRYNQFVQMGRNIDLYHYYTYSKATSSEDSPQTLIQELDGYINDAGEITNTTWQLDCLGAAGYNKNDALDPKYQDLQNIFH